MGFIGGLFAGLFGIFGNLFSKKEEFFLDLDDAKGEGKTADAPASAPATTPVAKTEVKKEAAPKAKKVEKAAPATTPVAKAKSATTPVVPANVIASNAPRRRPGPSLNQFKDMARQMNVRR
jgi:hypothetical protein